MHLIIHNCEIITGDGHTHYPLGYLVICEGYISEIGSGDYCGDAPKGANVFDARGGTVLPGLINAHAHGCLSGPLMPSGSYPMAPAEIRYQRNRHLLGGTTTLVNVCGLSLPNPSQSAGTHPLQVHWTTAHTPASIAAALAVDGRGLLPAHRRATIASATEMGAVGLGEGGGGQTLGGGAQDYLFIPRAIFEATGIKIEARDARLLKEMVLGRDLRGKGRANWANFILACKKLGLLEYAEPQHIAEVVTDIVMASVQKALEGLTELAHWSGKTGLPALLHTAAPSADTIVAVAQTYPQARLIAAHCNHPSFTPDEAVDLARRLKALGVVIEVCTLDTIATHWRNWAQNLDALIEADLVDILSTDYAGGHWDGILEAIHRMKDLGQLTTVEAVALATGNVARLFPAFDDRGTLAVGKRGDLIIADTKNLARVRHVLIAGKRVVKDGAIHPSG